MSAAEGQNSKWSSPWNPLHCFAAWFLARTYHLANMPGYERKLRLLVDWTVALLFDRDTAELGALERQPRLPGAPSNGAEDILGPGT